MHRIMNRSPLHWFTAVSSLFAVCLVALLPVSAQEENALLDIIETNQAIVDYPNDVTFRLKLTGQSSIAKAELIYDVSEFSCLEAASQVPVEVTGSLIEWTWVMVRSGNPPPGSELWWEWRLTDARGNVITTPRQRLTFTDDRFAWRTVEAEGVHLHWYEGNDVGPTLLDAAVAGLERLQNEMGIQLQRDVQLYIYGSSADMRDAVLYVQEWAGGIAFEEYDVILIGVPPAIADDWGRKTVRHELAHLVIGQFGRSCVGGSRPTWLNEGLAVFAEGDLQDDFAAALEDAQQNNGFEPIRTLSGAFPADENAAVLAYAQSYSVVDFLLDRYGQEKLQALLLTLAQGFNYDDALEQVYGMNADGLETEWREAIGAPERQISPTPTPIVAANVPTVVPMTAPENMPTPPAAAGPVPNAESQSPGFCGLGLIPLLLLGFVAGSKRDRGAPGR